MQIPNHPPDISDVMGLDWDAGIFTNKSLDSLTVYYTLRTLVFSLKSEGKFLKISYSSQYGTWAWSWKQPAFLLHLCFWKTGTGFCDCVFLMLWTSLYTNSPYHCTQEHHGLWLCSLVFNSIIFSPLVHITISKMFYVLFWLTCYRPKSFTSKYIFFFRIYVTL